MNNKERIGIIGTGYCLPETIRTNDNPIFDWLKQNNPNGSALFTGYSQRRVLAPSEQLIDIMLPAAQNALDAAGLAAKDIDVLLGYASVSEFIMPNALAQLHQKLEMSENALVLPICDEYTTLNSGILLAHSLIESGNARHALVVCGADWTRFVNYHTPQSISASDGAGAVVVSRLQRDDQFQFVGMETEIDSADYGAMFMQSDPIASASPADETTYTAPYFHITAAGIEAFKGFGADAPPRVANRLLKRHDLAGAEVTLISHQASSVLMEDWQNAIEPGQYINTIAEFGNMTHATMSVNLASHCDQIEHNALVLLGIGAQLQTTATLLRRNA